MAPRRLLSWLVLACSLLFVLPRGWCCIFAALASQATPAKRSCCAPDAPADTPASPQPKPAKCCPCDGRDTLRSQPESTPAPEALPCAWSVESPLPALMAHALVEPISDTFGPPPPLHLLKCSWLC